MVVFLLPDRCFRCKKKVKKPEKELFHIWLPVEHSRGKGFKMEHSKKQKEGIIFAYTPVVYLCKDCVRELNRWITGGKQYVNL